jgi:hypothetical protein
MLANEVALLGNWREAGPDTFPGGGVPSALIQKEIFSTINGTSLSFIACPGLGLVFA